MALTRSESRLKRGYNETQATRKARQQAEGTSLPRSVIAITIDQAIAIGLPVVGAAALITKPATALLIGVPLAIATGRAQRACEALTHEASHGNLHRADRDLNDRIGDVGAAWSVLSTVEAYRAGHKTQHHGLFGSASDPCRWRYEMAQFSSIRRDEGIVRFMADVLRRMPKYYRQWWTAIGSDGSALARALRWHAVVWTLVGGFAGAAIAVVAALMWLIAFSLVLPVIRFIGEADEHDYEKETESEATFSSLGRWQRLLFHPHADGLHNEHHRYTNVPFYRLPRLRRRLLAVDPSWRRAPTHRGVLRTSRWQE